MIGKYQGQNKEVKKSLLSQKELGDIEVTAEYTPLRVLGLMFGAIFGGMLFLAHFSSFVSDIWIASSLAGLSVIIYISLENQINKQFAGYFNSDIFKGVEKNFMLNLNAIMIAIGLSLFLTLIDFFGVPQTVKFINEMSVNIGVERDPLYKARVKEIANAGAETKQQNGLLGEAKIQYDNALAGCENLPENHKTMKQECIQIANYNYNSSKTEALTFNKDNKIDNETLNNIKQKRQEDADSWSGKIEVMLYLLALLVAMVRVLDVYLSWRRIKNYFNSSFALAKVLAKRRIFEIMNPHSTSTEKDRAELEEWKKKAMIVDKHKANLGYKDMILDSTADLGEEDERIRTKERTIETEYGKIVMGEAWVEPTPYQKLGLDESNFAKATDFEKDVWDKNVNEQLDKYPASKEEPTPTKETIIASNAPTSQEVLDLLKERWSRNGKEVEIGESLDTRANILAKSEKFKDGNKFASLFTQLNDFLVDSGAIEKKGTGYIALVDLSLATIIAGAFK